MTYVWEFEFFDSDGVVDAVPCGSLGGGGTFGSDLNDAVESAADFLACMVDDHLMGGIELPTPDFGHEPQHGGKIIAVAVSRKLADIPAITAADAARMLSVSSARVSQLIMLGYWILGRTAPSAWCPKLPSRHGSPTHQRRDARGKCLLPCKETPRHTILKCWPSNSLNSRRAASRIERPSRSQ